ncbi:MAG: Salicylate 1-monooxygenase, partial [Polaromonas sp.]|nr:Salicylate 1-monooxygenase [Polaromonas sp.]
MTKQVLVAGGGIGGLAAALALSRAGCDVRLFERASTFSEAGAGIQLGPNVVSILQAWGLAAALDAIAARPRRLQVRSALSGQLLAQMPLDTMAARYGAPYLAAHRGDLHALLLQAVQQTGTRLHTGKAITDFQQTAQAVTAVTADGLAVEADVLLGADGLWSTVRAQLLGDGPPRGTGHLAYRALVSQAALPDRLRTQDVTAWLGPRMHVVHYPVRGGAWLNVVAIVHGEVAAGAQDWDQAAHAADLSARLADVCAPLRDRVDAMPGWRLWSLHDRPPMGGAHQHAIGRVALLGDAAHPMLPYLAQGAGMAIEDAAELGHVLGLAGQAGNAGFEVPALLQRYALNRWQRNAKV